MNIDDLIIIDDLILNLIDIVVYVVFAFYSSIVSSILT
jgi:hypothetical protein